MLPPITKGANLITNTIHYCHIKYSFQLEKILQF